MINKSALNLHPVCNSALTGFNLISTGLLNEPCIDLCKEILNSEKTFEYLLDTYLTDEARKIYDENIGE